MPIDNPPPSDPNRQGTRKGLIPGTLEGDSRPIDPATGERVGGLDENYLDAGLERDEHDPVANLTADEAAERDGGPGRVRTASGRVVTRDEIGLHGDIPNPDTIGHGQDGPDGPGAEFSDAGEPAATGTVAEGPVSGEVGDLSDELDRDDVLGVNENIPEEVDGDAPPQPGDDADSTYEDRQGDQIDAKEQGLRDEVDDINKALDETLG